MYVSEEISFYQGSARERQTVNSTFMQLVDHLRDFILFRLSMGFIDTVIAKCKKDVLCVTGKVYSVLIKEVSSLRRCPYFRGSLYTSLCSWEGVQCPYFRGSSYTSLCS